ncbi:MAG: histidine--tRNA ligase [Nitrospirota bacterium]
MPYKAVKGMQDILPPDVYVWQAVEDAARRVFRAFGFHEMRPPVLESTDVFTRSIGESTDIVEKEMYTFQDKGGRSISLRPEGTASVVRAYVEHHLQSEPSPQKYYYMGPMFRYERPQKGRLRQFYQLGAEAFGVAEPGMDAEVISMVWTFLGEVGLGSLSLEVNSIGCRRCRPAYTAALREYFSEKLPLLCPDCQRRHERNPLRIFDCKVPACVELRKGAPRVSDFLCGDCRVHFAALRGYLEDLGIPYRVSPEMVRGLDYYTRTTFELTTERLGAQNAVAAGGRYDRLVKEFGGPDVPAMGFALGVERLVALIREERAVSPPRPELFVACLGQEASREALKMAQALRGQGVWVETGYEGASLKSQLRRADRFGAGLVFIIGEDELARGQVGWKDMARGTSGEVPMGEALRFFKGERDKARVK